MNAVAVRNPECPICGETFQDGRGLSGHLQFKHSLSGDDHREMLDEGMEKGEKAGRRAPDESGGWSGRSLRDRELELKGMLQECKEKQEEVRKQDRSWGVFGIPIQTDVEAQEKLEELEKREGKIRERLQEIQNRTAN
jgi:hypothetical protein